MTDQPDMKTLKPDELVLLEEVLTNQAPHLLGDLLQKAKSNTLTREDREVLIELTTMEFTWSGLKGDYEPNERGLKLENLIDTINRPLVEGTG